MAQGSAGEGSSAGAAGGLSLGFLGPILVIVLFFALSAGAAGNPNPNGKEANPPHINANPTTSSLSTELGDLKRYQNVNDYLAKGSSLLSDLQARLELLDGKLVSGTDYTSASGTVIPGATVTKIKTVIEAIVADLNNIKAQVGANTPKGAASYLADLTTNLNKLQLLTTGGSAANFAQTATQIVNDNNDGKGSIKFPDPDTSAIIYGADKTKPVYLDCAGFVSYALQKAGVFRAGESATTIDFVNTKATDSRFQVVDFVDGGKLDLATITKDAQPGDIFISNTGDKVSVNSNRQDHAFIYLGPVGGTPMVAESTDGETPGKNGPQFDSLQDRYDHHGNIQMILRPVGVAQ